MITTVLNVAGPTLTIKSIIETIDKLRPLAPPILVSSRMFPSDCAWQIRAGDEDFFCTHPSTWRAMQMRPGEQPLSPFAIKVIDLDDPRYSSERLRVFDALADATGGIRPSAFEPPPNR